MTIRIGHCIHGLGLGGAQEVIKTLVAGTAGDGFEHVVYSCEGGLFEDRLEEAGARVRILPRHVPKFDPFWVAHLAKAMRSDDVDLVHTHLFGDSLHGVLAARRIGLPTLMTLHLPFRNVRGFQRRGYVWLLHKATRVVACSAEAQRTFSEAADGVVEIETIPNGVDDREPSLSTADARRRLHLPEDGLVVGAIGRLAAEKGLPLLLAAFAQLPDVIPPTRLVLIGAGEERASLQSEARRLGIEARTTFAGERRDVRELLSAFDVVASSSLGEGLPLSLLEAMCAARALVWTDVDGMSTTVRHEREALLVPANDREAFADALGRVLCDADLRTRLGTAARTRFEESFTSAHMIRRYRATYEALYRTPASHPQPNQKAA